MKGNRALRIVDQDDRILDVSTGYIFGGLTIYTRDRIEWQSTQVNLTLEQLDELINWLINERALISDD